jgi:hypothetical protein
MLYPRQMASQQGPETRPDLDPLYLNQRRIAALVGDEALARALSRVRPGMSGKMQAIAEAIACKQLFREWLLSVDPPPPAFEMTVASGGLRVGRIVTTFRDFYFRNVREERRAQGDGKPSAHAVYEAIAEATNNFKLTLLLNREHVLPGSPGDLLTGRVSDVFVVAAVHEVLDEEVLASPIFIGRKMVGPAHFLSQVSPSSCEVPPDAIDSFALVRTEPHPKKTDLPLLKNIPEERVKNAFASILNEENVPKDWGGEQSDLFTSHLQLRGSRVPAAFVFKGPAQFRPMTMAQLGHNGDQLVRLAQEPADLLIVQHCHEITKPVRAMLRALCNQVGLIRRCSVIDGYDTIRILRAYGQCGFTPSVRAPNG